MVVGSKGPATPTGPESPAGPIDDQANPGSRRRPGRKLLVPATLQAAGMESLGLDSRILEAVRALGIETFTEPQERAIPRILAGANVLLVAPTGIGKTEAALLPILDRILRDKPEPTSCLYITPLRALNRDMLRRMTFFAALRRCYELIKEHQSTLFFVNTRDTAEFLSSRLTAWYQDPKIGVHHGSLSKEVRVQMEDEFKSGGLRALVCTSSLELGIDVETADLVVRKDNRSVLANQLVALAVSERFASLDEAYETVRRSWPFRELKRADFDEVVAQLAGLRILWSRDGRLGRSSNSLPYFFENISMIPDVKTYRVIDLSSRRAIGTRFTIARARDVLIVTACFGSKVNEPLAQLISSLISARFGQSVGVQTDPYRIVLEVPRSVNPQQVIETLRPEDPDALEPLLRVILKNSAFLRWAFVYVAKKFGALRRDVDWESVSIPRLLKTFENTPLFEEVLDKVFWERMDIPRTVEVLRRIHSGGCGVGVTRLTPNRRAGPEGGRLPVAPSRGDHPTLMAGKARLEKETGTFLCLNCQMCCREVVRD